MANLNKVLLMGNLTRDPQLQRTIKEHGMLFRAEMVRALLDGRKTQTRRIVTPRNSLFDGWPWMRGLSERMEWADAYVDPGPSPAGNPGPYLKVPWRDSDDERLVSRIYSRVQPGDMIWVRETWCSVRPTAYRADATEESELLRREMGFKWSSAIHMPRWAARIVLNVTKVRAERVQDITEADAQAEGMERVGDQWRDYLRQGKELIPGLAGSARAGFEGYWDSLADDAEGQTWEENPWVWVYEFARC